MYTHVCMFLAQIQSFVFFFPEKYPFISYEQHYKKSKVIPFFIQHAEIHWICHNTAFARPS